jgi:hypothetical protein
MPRIGQVARDASGARVMPMRQIKFRVSSNIPRSAQFAADTMNRFERHAMDDGFRVGIDAADYRFCGGRPGRRMSSVRRTSFEHWSGST